MMKLPRGVLTTTKPCWSIICSSSWRIVSAETRCAPATMTASTRCSSWGRFIPPEYIRTATVWVGRAGC